MGEGVTLHPKVKQYRLVVYTFRRWLSKRSGFPEAPSTLFCFLLILPLGTLAWHSLTHHIYVGMTWMTHLSALLVTPFVLTAVLLHEPDWHASLHSSGLPESLLPCEGHILV